MAWEGTNGKRRDGVGGRRKGGVGENRGKRRESRLGAWWMQNNEQEQNNEL